MIEKRLNKAERWRQVKQGQAQVVLLSGEAGIGKSRLVQAQTVHEIEPDADIILYVSRARGDVHPESDWDFLIFLGRVVDDECADAVRHRLYEIERDCGEVLSSMVRSCQEWDTPLHQVTPLCKVMREQGIRI